MFSIQPLTSIRSLQGRQQFETLLTSADAKEVRQIWVSPGHVFVSWDSGHRLTTFDTVPAQTPFVAQPGNKYGDETGGLDLHRQDTEVATLCFKKNNPAQVYIIFANGEVEVWGYVREDGPNNNWTLNGSFQLWEEDSGKRVCSALLNEEQNCLYWCEKRVETRSPSLTKASDNGTHFVHCVSKKGLPLSHETISSSTVGSTFALLEHCPPCQLYPTQDGVVIWPEQPCPPGVYFIWQQTKTVLQQCNLGNGCVATQTLVSNGMSFADAIKSLVCVWAQGNQSRTSGIITTIKDFSRDRLLVIFENGDVKSLSNQGSLEHRCHIAQWAAVFESVAPGDCEWFLFAFVLGLVLPDGKVLLFHAETGMLVQEIEHFSAPDFDGGSTYLWVGSGCLPSVGFWNPGRGVWQLCMSDLKSTGPVLHLGKHVELMSGLGQSSHAARLTLEEAYKYYRDRSIHGKNIDLNNLMKNCMLQSPALLVALLHGHSSQVFGHVEREHIAQLMTFHNSSSSSGPVTRLQETLHPLLEQFWNFETKWRSLISSHETTEQARQEEIVQSEVRMLLKSGESISPSNMAQLELLTLHFPTQGLRTLVQDLHINDVSEINQLGSDQENMWPVVLGTERTSSNMPVFELICRLLYREEPLQLLAFVQKASYVKDAINGSSALSSSSSLYDRAFHCLPVPEKSCTNTDAVVAYCELLATTSKKDAVLEALKLLLRSGRMEEAVSLVSKYPGDESNQQHSSALFHTLLTNILESGTLQSMDRSIWDLMPKNFGADQLLSLIREHLSSGDKGRGMRQRVLCSSPNDVSLSVLKGVLLSTILEHDDKKD